MKNAISLRRLRSPAATPSNPGLQGLFRGTLKRRFPRSGARAAIWVSLILAGVAPGAILSIDDPIFGPNALTRDTDQGLDFLDLTLSRSDDYGTYNDILSELAPGGAFEGFRFASEPEVIALINNFGFSPTVDDTPTLGSGPTTFGNIGGDQLSGLVELLGVSGTGIVGGTNTEVRFSSGLTSTLIQAPWTIYDVRVISLIDANDSSLDDWVNRGGGRFDDLSHPLEGAFLVKSSSSAIPEPGMSLACAVACGLLLSRRRR